ncbi:MAG: bifunctional folylpolyglutamate synthase/dihydrofolate synthase [Chloroflexota bacterium]|nr:MAG: bifunctional folylpolyglutamate synthase/dihydrofolate synthase [Chloroflexota bacterium]
MCGGIVLTYKDALDYIYGFTDYEKQTAFQYTSERFDLGRVVRLLGLLDNPHHRFRSIHVAGTKGKGSTSAMLASILRAAGYRVGLYTSPHLHTFRERIRLDGEIISEGSVAALTERLQPLVAQVPDLTTFEVITVLACEYFAENAADLVVLEVGLGGRLDATNVVTPLVAVITPISFDHVQYLGHTLTAIATEKAGIIKPGVPVVSAPQPAEALTVIEAVCLARGAPLTVVDRAWTWRSEEATPEGQTFSARPTGGTWNTYRLPLLGNHQLGNAATALTTVDVLRGLGIDIPSDAVVNGLANVHWPGRLEVMGRHPWVVVDGAHNGDSAQKLAAALPALFPYRRMILVYGALAGHSVPDMLAALLPVADEVILTRVGNPRGVDPATLLVEVQARGRQAECVAPVGAALERALRIASAEDLVCVTGSLYVVADARVAWYRHVGEPEPPTDP